MSQPSDCVLEKFSFRTAQGSQTSLNSHRSKFSSCRICLSSILNPASLSCGHRFCEKCLNMYWKMRDKPDFLVCPLCRSFAFNVDFAKRAEVSSTEEFRKMFDLDTEEMALSHTQMQVDSRRSTIWLTTMMVLPALYFAFRLLIKPTLDKLMSNLL